MEDRAEVDYSEAASLARELGQSTELAASLAGLVLVGGPTAAWPDPGERGTPPRRSILARRHRLHLDGALGADGRKPTWL